MHAHAVACMHAVQAAAWAWHSVGDMAWQQLNGAAQRSMLSTLPCPAHRLPSHHLCHCSQQAKPHMEASMVADNESGAAVASKVRTSTGTFFALGDDEIITRIEKRVAQVSMIPVSE